MAREKICPTCGHANLPGTMLCVRCFSLLEESSGNTEPVLSVTTEHIPSVTSILGENYQTSESQAFEEAWQQNTLEIFVSGFADPIVVRFAVQVVLGRYTPNNPQAEVVDLTGYNALELGVSRMHLVLRRTNIGLIAEDMASTNGTWVNGSRLSPYAPVVLKHQQKIRLGRLELELHFNFNDPTA